MNKVVIIGGGMAGLAAGWRLSLLGVPVVIIEGERQLGGLARSFELDGRQYPLGYHHILSTDRALVRMLARTGLLRQVIWSFQRMAFALDGGFYNLSDPRSVLRMPLSGGDKLGMMRVLGAAMFNRVLRTGGSVDAATWLRRRGGGDLLERFFEPLARLKFGVGCDELSAEWLQARICAWEGIGRLGYIPGVNWAHELVAAMSAEIQSRGGELRAGDRVTRMSAGAGNAMRHVKLASGEQVEGSHFICTIPTPVLPSMMERFDEHRLDWIRYTRAVSCIVGCRELPRSPYYWTNFLSPPRSFGGMFRLELLNPSLGPPGVHLVNFVTHMGSGPGEGDDLIAASDDEIAARYLEDYRRSFDQTLNPDWARVSRIAHYSPVFCRGYRNPPPRSPVHPNLYFAGNFRTYPRITSTGQALDSGVEVADLIFKA